jgi:peptidoglycan/LPS O-acetylase OafA/YrhL
MVELPSLTKLNSFARSNGRVPGIDLLRGFCIVAVVLHHINLRIRFHESTLGKWIGPTGDKVLFWSGYYGVRIFFVISGFLITSWSIKRWGTLEKIRLRPFYLMRLARIVPCLVGLLALLTVLDRAGVPRFTINPQHTSLGRALLAALTFHINGLEARTGYLPAAWDVLWSLSVEEVFYVFFPVLCILLRRQALIVALLFGFVTVGPFGRVLTHSDLWADYGYLACMDGIAFGCLAAIFADKVKLGGRSALAFLLSGIGLCVFIDVFRGTAARLGLYKTGLDVTVLEIGVVLLVIALTRRLDRDTQAGQPAVSAARAGLNAFLRNTTRIPTLALRWYGRNSYEIYLIHMLVVWPMVMIVQRKRWSVDLAPLWFLITTALAGIIGNALARLNSEPVNRALRSRFLATGQGAGRIF